jgi:hypothetical protein
VTFSRETPATGQGWQGEQHQEHEGLW